MNSEHKKILELMEAVAEQQRLGEVQKKIAEFEPFININVLPDLTLTEIIDKINVLGEANLFNDENFRLIFALNSQIDRHQVAAVYREKAKGFQKAKAFDDLLKGYRAKEKTQEKQKQVLELQYKKSHLTEIRKNFPIWVIDGKINEVVFCREYQRNNGIKCINGHSYNIDGFISEDKIKSEIQDLISPFINVQLSKTTVALLKALKNNCYHEIPAPNEQEIHLQNGILKINGSFTKQPVFCLNRLNVSFVTDYKPPAAWRKFLNDLLQEEDIITLQEYMGYCLIPSTRAQTMLFLIGNGGEGKSRIGTVLKEIFNASAIKGSLTDLENDKYTLASIENSLLFIDDDLSTEGLKDTKNIKRIVTAEGKMQINQKFQPIREALIYARLIAFGNTPLKALYDYSEGFFRRQIIIQVKPKPENRADDKNLIDKLLQEKEMIFLWMFEGLQNLIKNGYHFTLSEQTRRSMEEIKEESCNVIAFLKDSTFVVYEKSFKMTSRNVYDLYLHWCETNADKPLAQKTMLNYLKTNAKKFEIKPAVLYDWEKRQARGFMGIGDAHKFNNSIP